MRLLSSTDNEDHGKALSNFWGEVKNYSNLHPTYNNQLLCTLITSYSMSMTLSKSWH
jgi:hypothetical protein